MTYFIFKKKFTQVIIHIIAWAVFLFLLSSLVHRPPEMNRFLSILVPDIFFISFFYFNLFFLTPKYFIRNRYLSFGLICLGFLIPTIAVPSVISEVSGKRPELPEVQRIFEFHPATPPPDFENSMFEYPGKNKPPERFKIFIPEFSYTIFVFLFILILSTGICIYMQWQQSEKAKVNAELSFLKAQINPHFLFNTLNNIYSMAVNKEEKTSDAIEMFSDMMRFIIYETSHEFVKLNKKIEYIDTYIDLQKLRLSSSVHVNYEKYGDYGSLQIAPLILIPFIENAFKYGVSTEKESIIDVKIEVNENHLDLFVRNSKFHVPKNDSEISQLGLENTKRRLKLIYPGKHLLKISDDPFEYIVNLHLNLT
jgi:hypothetical protein